MKNRMKTTVVISLLFFSLVACEKGPFDYRTKYVGTYDFVIHRESGDPINGHLDTTYTIDGRIDYGSAKHAISISLHEDAPLEFTLYEDGTIEGRNNVCKGEFESSDKVHYSCYAASPASHSTTDVKGEKK